MNAGSEPPFSATNFIGGYLFVLSCQLMAHFLGEYYDYPSDLLNVNSSVFTGGSKVLLR